jgi:hypothetical protein
VGGSVARQILRAERLEVINTTPAGIVLGVGFDLDGSSAASVWEDTYTGSLAPGASATLTATGGSAGVNYWIATTDSPTAKASGQVVIAFTQAAADNPEVNGIEILQ